MNASRILAALLGVYLAAVLQHSLAPRMAILGAQPDFFLVFVCGFAPYSRPSGGILLGGLAGLFQGGLPSANVAHYVISRALTGFAVSAANGLRLAPTPLIAAGTAAIGTLFAKLVWMFLAGPPHIGAFLGDTIRTAMYNGVLAVPLYALLKKIFGTPLP